MIKCPSCNYSEETGSHGEFYRLPIMLERKSPDWYSIQQVRIYGCPKCKKTFIK